MLNIIFAPYKTRSRGCCCVCQLEVGVYSCVPGLVSWRQSPGAKHWRVERRALRRISATRTEAQQRYLGDLQTLSFSVDIRTWLELSKSKTILIHHSILSSCFELSCRLRLCSLHNCFSQKWQMNFFLLAVSQLFMAL